MGAEPTSERGVGDPSFGRPVTTEAVETEEGEVEGAEVWNDEQEPGEATRGHSPFVPDPIRNVPKPQPVPDRPAGQQRPRKRLVEHTRGKPEPDPQPELEKEQVGNLKQQYASHCQMCLCERVPSELAPPNSYVQWEEVRRSVIHGHHVDPKSGGGARHAGNIILLCKFHHDNVGRRLAREAITSALRSDSHPKRLNFNFGDGESTSIGGHEVKVIIPDTGEVVILFFTTEHAGYWLSRSPLK